MYGIFEKGFAMESITLPKNRLIAVALSLLLVCSFIPTVGFATETGDSTPQVVPSTEQPESTGEVTDEVTKEDAGEKSFDAENVSTEDQLAAPEAGGGGGRPLLAFYPSLV